jgi:uncharacterized protein YbcI
VNVQRDATDQSPLARISTRFVQLHNDHYGRGPEKAKTYFQDDLVVVLMRGGFTKVEETLLQGGSRRIGAPAAERLPSDHAASL